MKKKYNLEDLVAECDMSKEAPQDIQEWENMPDVCEEDWGQLGK